MEKLTDKKISLILLVLSCLAVMVSIRLSSYILPQKYYFSISSVFKSDDSLMLVEHPGLSGKRFCELARKHNISEKDFGFESYSCKETLEAGALGIARELLLSEKQKDQIFEQWFLSRRKIATEIMRKIQEQTSREIITNEVQSITYNPDFSSSFLQTELTPRFSNYAIPNLSIIINETIGAEFSTKFSQYSDQSRHHYEKLNNDDESPKNTELSRLEREQLMAGVKLTTINSAMQNAQNSDSFLASRVEIENMINSSTSVENIPYNIQGLYQEMLPKLIQKDLKKHLENESVFIKKADAIKKVKAEFLLENLPIYTVSAVIRVTIVFLAVFIVAFLLISIHDTLSLATGALFASIMLTWPVLSLWSWVVQEEWQSMKTVFLGIYVIYSFAFFFTGKTAALSAVIARKKLHNQQWLKMPTYAQSPVAKGLNVSAKEFLTNLSITVCLNLLAFALNIIVPTNA